MRNQLKHLAKIARNSYQKIELLEKDRLLRRINEEKDFIALAKQVGMNRSTANALIRESRTYNLLRGGRRNVKTDAKYIKTVSKSFKNRTAMLPKSSNLYCNKWRLGIRLLCYQRRWID